jgi:hypothetical protein
MIALVCYIYFHKATELHAPYKSILYGCVSVEIVVVVGAVWSLSSKGKIWMIIVNVIGSILFTLFLMKQW